MPDKNPSLIDEALALFFKVLLPAMVGVSIKIAIEMERKKMTIRRAVISIVSGAGLAWLFSPIILNAIGLYWQPLIIAIVAITSERIIEYVLYKWDVDYILGALVEAFKNFIINLFTGKKN